MARRQVGKEAGRYRAREVLRHGGMEVGTWEWQGRGKQKGGQQGGREARR